MNKVKNIVLIGAGYWGEKILDKLIQLNQKVILLDKDIKKYKKFENKYKTKKIIYLKTFKDLDNSILKVITQVLPKIIFHTNYFINLKKIFVEKPICITENELKDNSFFKKL